MGMGVFMGKMLAKGPKKIAPGERGAFGSRLLFAVACSTCMSIRKETNLMIVIHFRTIKRSTVTVERYGRSPRYHSGKTHSFLYPTLGYNTNTNLDIEIWPYEGSGNV